MLPASDGFCLCRAVRAQRARKFCRRDCFFCLTPPPFLPPPPPHAHKHTQTFCFIFPPLENRRKTRIILLLDSLSILWCFVGWKGFWELKGWSVFLDFKYVHKLSSVVHKKCQKLPTGTKSEVSSTLGATWSKFKNDA